jgi:hypothetical protein
MNMIPSFTNLRGFVAYQFTVLRMRALRGRIWAKLSGMPSELIVFPGDNEHSYIIPHRKLVGIKNIRVTEIVGTLSRETDFDIQFRPLKKHVLTRWVNAYILHEQNGWSPIIVHKVRNEYFVEDGHHRVSVARAMGMEYIEAKVWDYSPRNQPAEKYHWVRCTEKSSVKAYMTG